LLCIHTSFSHLTSFYMHICWKLLVIKAIQYQRHDFVECFVVVVLTLKSLMVFLTMCVLKAQTPHFGNQQTLQCHEQLVVFIWSTQYVTLQKCLFFTSKFSCTLICNPTHKTETRRANRWGTTNSKPPGPIIMSSTLFEHPMDQLAELASLLLPSHQFHLYNWLVVSNSQIVVNAEFS
jgi:hypothetical protein